MIFRQLFEKESSTYSYLIGCTATRAAILIDAVKSEVPHYLQLLEELDLRLTCALDTHTHADHITGAGTLRDATGCMTLLGKESGSSCVSQTVQNGDRIPIGNLSLAAIYTPGHTDDSYCYLLEHEKQDYLFTGDTLLIRSTGRTDFQNGNPAAQHHSLFSKLLTLPDTTWVYPAHDYKGWLVSTIGEERRHNPRLQMKDISAYVTFMNILKLPNPTLMDIAVPANRDCGK